MALSQDSLEFHTNPKSFLDITRQVQDFVTKSNIQNGLGNLIHRFNGFSTGLEVPLGDD